MVKNNKQQTLKTTTWTLGYVERERARENCHIYSSECTTHVTNIKIMCPLLWGRCRFVAILGFLQLITVSNQLEQVAFGLRSVSRFVCWMNKRYACLHEFPLSFSPWCVVHDI
jgi:hypothetical protein